MFANRKLISTKRQVCGRFQNGKHCTLLAVAGVDYFKVESRKFKVALILNSKLIFWS